MTLRSYPSTGPAWARSSALPCGMPSTMSTSTTSASSFDAIQWAQVAPTLPAPMTVTLFLRGMWLSSRVRLLFRRFFVSSDVALHVADDRGAELGALDLFGAGHLTGEIVGHRLLLDGLGHAGQDERAGLVPAQVLEHHDARQDDRARVDPVEV